MEAFAFVEPCRDMSIIEDDFAVEIALLSNAIIWELETMLKGEEEFYKLMPIL